MSRGQCHVVLVVLHVVLTLWLTSFGIVRIFGAHTAGNSSLGLAWWQPCYRRTANKRRGRMYHLFISAPRGRARRALESTSAVLLLFQKDDFVISRPIGTRRPLPVAGRRSGEVFHSYVALLVVEGMSSNVCVLLLFVVLLNRVVYCNVRSVHTVGVFKRRADVLVDGNTTPYLGIAW